MRTEIMKRKNGHRDEEDRSISPLAAIRETEKEFIAELDMPGLSKESINISFNQNEMTVTGHRHDEIPKGYSPVFQERAPFGYRRTFEVNTEIDSANIKAAYDNGVLTVTLPKSERVQPKRITVQ